MGGMGDRQMSCGPSRGPKELFAPDMPTLAALIAPLALVLPLGVMNLASPEDAEGAPEAEQVREGDRALDGRSVSARRDDWNAIVDSIMPGPAQQVRIERRVILRISPARPSRQNLTAEVPQQERPRTRLVERKAGKCIESARIGGVSDRGDRLLILMRDRTMMTARLEKGCSPRDFYRGFYVERSDDGKICVNRDRIMSRSGAKCQIDRFSQLVAEELD